MEKLLLHSCCGPCSTQVIEELKKNFEIVVFYNNPNIFPYEQYLLRFSEQKRYCLSLNIEVIEGDYDEEKFVKSVNGLEFEPEGGKRCKICFENRLQGLIEKAKELGIKKVTTTLTVSPHKNAVVINEVGENLAKNAGVEFLSFDFKLNDGFKKSTQLTKDFGLYRQSYCGCRFSRR